MQFFESFSSKHLVGTEILYTFALALQNKPPGKLLKAVKKEFFEKDLHKQRSSTRSVCLVLYQMDG